MTNRRQALLASTLLTAAAVLALAPQAAFAQPAAATTAAPAPDQPEDATAVGELVVTGTRIPKNEFTSASPIQVLTAERAQSSGLSDTTQFLQSSTLAAGSPQINSTISSAFVTDGGPGAATISLRGLGAQRTLVLLNGRRAGPAGTRGGVSAFDLNVLPESSIDRIEILKDGASSIYGSDAIAGVVNIITKKKHDGGEVDAFYTGTTDKGGEQANISGSWGKTFSRGYINASFDYYKQFEQRNGDRAYTDCTEDVIFNPTTGARADIIDPRTGAPKCNGTLYDQIWIYGANGSTRQGRLQFNYANNLQNFIPKEPGPRDGICPPANASGTPTTAGQNDADCYPTSPPGFFIVGSNNLSRTVQDAHSPLESAQSLIPDTDRYTANIESAFELTPNIELYTEVLLNRRETRTHGFRQIWTYNYTFSYGDPFSVGFNGPFVLSPTFGTNFFDAKQKVDYTRIVAGARGDIHSGILNNWNWDLFAQRSHSRGIYSQEVFLKDAALSQSYRTGSCVGTKTPISNRSCIDINFTDPRILAGLFNPTELAFLTDQDVGKTDYTQTYLEGSLAGNAFKLPAGPVGVALGFHVQHDKILDVPGAVSRSGNNYLLSSAGITQGHDDTKEGYGELSIPILRDKPFVELLGVSLSGRYTDVKSAGTAETYKAGLNWQVIPAFKIRATHGTSFRAPALFELFLRNQTSFLSQRQVDPCINSAFNLANGLITQRLFNNCSNAAGPGGGVPTNATGSGAGVTITTGGGFGTLKPETSRSDVYGVVWTPKFADLSVSVDYFEINIKGEVTALGANQIVGGCYNSPTFPTDPLCTLFTRNSNTKRIDTVTAKYINIANQENRGIDATIRYRHTLPWQTDLTIDGQFTWQLEDTTGLFPGTDINSNHTVGDPQFVGNLDFEFRHKDWTLLYGANLIGEQSDFGTYGSNTVTILGVTSNVKANAEFKAFYHLSLKKDYDKWSVLAGVANLFDEKPPFVTTVQSNLGQYNTIGTSVLASQYTEGYYGRRWFMRLNKKF